MCRVTQKPKRDYNFWLNQEALEKEKNRVKHPRSSNTFTDVRKKSMIRNLSLEETSDAKGYVSLLSFNIQAQRSNYGSSRLQNFRITPLHLLATEEAKNICCLVTALVFFLIHSQTSVSKLGES